IDTLTLGNIHMCGLTFAAFQRVYRVSLHRYRGLEFAWEGAEMVAFGEPLKRMQVDLVAGGLQHRQSGGRIVALGNEEIAKADARGSHRLRQIVDLSMHDIAQARVFEQIGGQQDIQAEYLLET